MPPLVGVAVYVTVVPKQTEPAGLPAMLTLTGKFGFTVMLSVLEVAGLPVAQVALDVTMHVTASLLFSVVVVKVVELVPAFTPFTCHWYAGVVPPLVGVAVNVTLLPAQMVVAGLAAILTLTGKLGFTDIVMVLDVPGLPVAQVALDVSTQVTASVLFSVADEYVVELVPTFTPFTFH